MANPQIIYDPALEIAAFVDIDTRQGWGPAFIGPGADDVLRAWMDTMPLDVGVMSGDDAQLTFVGWLSAKMSATPEAPPASPNGPVEPMGGQGLDSTPPDRTGPADGLSEPPEPAPADTDMEADQGTPPTVVQCPLCGGAGVTTDSEDGTTTTCAMCQGTKVVRMQVPS